MSVKTYSLKADGNKKLSTNFTVSEFRCKDGSDKILISDELVSVLQKIRDHFGKPITINSAYRNASYNIRIGGASKSQHVYGTAADIVVKDVNPEKVAQYAEYLMPHTGGIGLYNNFVHVDVRTNRSRWKNSGREVGVSGFPGYKAPIKAEVTKPKSIETTKDIVAELSKRGIITNEQLWLTKCESNSNAYWLAYKGANLTMNKTTKTNLTSVNDIVWELEHRNIMTDKELWLKLLEEDKDLYWLAFKICNYTKNK